MTSTRIYTATWEEFAIANELDCAQIKGQHDITHDLQLELEEYPHYYNASDENRKIGTITGLMIMLAIVNKIVRQTILPKSRNPEAIRAKY